MALDAAAHLDMKRIQNDLKEMDAQVESISMSMLLSRLYIVLCYIVKCYFRWIIFFILIKYESLLSYLRRIKINYASNQRSSKHAKIVK